MLFTRNTESLIKVKYLNSFDSSVCKTSRFNFFKVIAQ